MSSIAASLPTFSFICDEITIETTSCPEALLPHIPVSFYTCFRSLYTLRECIMRDQCKPSDGEIGWLIRKEWVLDCDIFPTLNNLAILGLHSVSVTEPQYSCRLLRRISIRDICYSVDERKPNLSASCLTQQLFKHLVYNLGVDHLWPLFNPGGGQWRGNGFDRTWFYMSSDASLFAVSYLTLGALSSSWPLSTFFV